jgi:hypothetical protein
MTPGQEPAKKRVHECESCGEDVECTSDEPVCPSKTDGEEILCPECFYDNYGGCG